MTYTYKLSRRLAILRDLTVLPVVLLAACMGETTGPESTTNAIPVTPIAFRVVPSAVTIETKQEIRFRGESKTRRGENYPSPLSWETNGGSIERDGTFSATESGHLQGDRPRPRAAAPRHRDRRRRAARIAIWRPGSVAGDGDARRRQPPTASPLSDTSPVG